MKYCMCFFPLVGAVIGAVFYGLCYIGRKWDIPDGLLSAVLTIAPVLLTGGIHLDGYLDTLDARASYGTKEKKLAILKDSHVGAFAVIGCVVYFLLQYGLFMGLLGRDMTDETFFQAAAAMAAGMVLTRAFSGLSVVSFPLAKNSGFVAMFSNAAQKKTVRITMAACLMAALCLAVWCGGVYGCGAAAACGTAFYYYYRMAKKEFGGTTGDLAGYYVCLAELLVLLVTTAEVMLLC